MCANRQIKDFYSVCYGQAVIIISNHLKRKNSWKNTEMPVKVFLLSLLVFTIQQVNSDKIIVFHLMASYSHRIQTWPLAEALSLKGHEVTYISPFHPKEPNPNITELVAREHEEIMRTILDAEMDINLKISGQIANLVDVIYDSGLQICEALLTSQDFKDWLIANPRADLVIIDNCLADCGTGIAYKLGAKYIYFSTIPVHPYEYDTIGFLPTPSEIPELETYTRKTPMGFIDRILNTLESLKWRWLHYQYAPKMDELIRKELNIRDMPYIEELIRNPSLIFYTGDAISDYPRSLPPLFVNIAGIHTRKSTKPLPEDLEKFISSGDSDAGFIYISLGSLIISSNLPPHIKKIFFDVIKAFPQVKFLWKWNGESPDEMPNNLYLSKWFPQIDVLGHPKIKGFITQCGRPSLLEALFNGVPMISFPTFGDQEINADRMKEMGAMVRLDIATITFEALRDGVKQVLYDPVLRARTSKLQQMFLDRPMTPLETAVWWTEYVLRNEDLRHLRPAGNDQYWFVRRQVDVWATLSIALFILVSSILYILCRTLNKLINIFMKEKPKAD